MDQAKDELGRWGEAQAARFLKKQGLRVLERNVELPAGEIDLVARDGDALVIVEVKTRAEADFGGPLAAINPSKRRKLVILARSYLARHRLGETPCRFDIVGVTQKLNSPEPEIEYIRDAFDASGRTT
jgi:putative endonuclease